MPLSTSQLTGFNAARAGGPASDPNLWLWVASDYGVTYDPTSKKMSSNNNWLDRSSGARHLSSNADRYTLYKLSAEAPVALPSGKPVIRFDPTDLGVTIPTQWTPQSGGLANLSRNCTVYMLLMIPTWQYPKYVFDGGNVVRANTAGISMQPNTSGKLSLSSPLLAPSLATFPTGAWFVLTAKFAGAASTLQVNNLAPVTGNPTDATTIDPMWAWIGGIQTVGAYHAKFDLGACIISNASNGDAIQAVHKNYLATYGGVTI
jgi:hypothetical protein